MKQDENKHHDKQKQETQKILQKIEQQSSVQKKQKVISILHRTEKPSQTFSWWSSIRNNLQISGQTWFRRLRSKQNHHIMILSIFAILSTYTCWIIENRYDQMRRKANKSQTYKQRLVEKENEYINEMLNKNEFESVPIPNQIQSQYTYKFQQEDERRKIEFDTKDDLLQAMKEQYENGVIIDSVYEQELRNRKLID